jgi:REP element-mobilizing transposase RayT
MPLFGEIVDGKMRLNDAGRMVEDEWLRTSVVRLNVELDACVVMPNHIHGIICIVGDGRGTACRAPTDGAGSA